MSDDIPEPWRKASERKGISPTYRPLAAAAGLSHETVRKVVQGRRTSTASIRKMADVLGVDVETIHEWRGEAPPDYGREFVPDESSSLLTTDEREAINVMIRLLTRSRSEQKAGEGHADRPAPSTQAGGSPADRRPTLGELFEQVDEMEVVDDTEQREHHAQGEAYGRA